jgi:hypothetical protein
LRTLLVEMLSHRFSSTIRAMPIFSPRRKDNYGIEGACQQPPL